MHGSAERPHDRARPEKKNAQIVHGSAERPHDRARPKKKNAQIVHGSASDTHDRAWPRNLGTEGCMTVHMRGGQVRLGMHDRAERPHARATVSAQ